MNIAVQLSAETTPHPFRSMTASPRLSRLPILALALSLWSVAGTGEARTSEVLAGNPGYVHEVFTVDDGLPMGGLTQALQTRDGYLWFATFDGLVRFDGVRFEVFDSERVPALGSNRIQNLLESRGGALWILSEQGNLARYEDGVFTGCGRPAAGRAACGSSVAGPAWYTLLDQDATGTVWLSGPSGLLRWTGEELREIPGTKTGTGGRSLLRDRSGRLWVTALEGLWTGVPGRLFRRVDLPAREMDDDHLFLAEDGAGGIWIATTRGVGRFRDGALRLEVPGSGYVVPDGRGGVLIATAGRLLRARGGSLQTVLTSTATISHRLLRDRNVSLGPGGEEWLAWRDTLYRNGVPVLRLSTPFASFNSVLRDDAGSLWITTSSSGELHALHPARVTTYTEGLPNPNIYPVYEDRDGTILAGGAEFFAALAPGARRFVPRDWSPGPQQSVFAFLRDRAGTLWVGTTRGLYAEGPDGMAPAGPPEDTALRSTAIRAIFEDSRGVLWVGTNIGLARREPAAAGGRWSWIRPENGLPFPWVRVIKETADGALWLGTNGGGVIRLKDGRFTSITTARGLSSNVVRSIYAGPRGRLWIGTEGRGLNRLDADTVDSPGGPRIAVLTTRQGLHANGIHQIVGDGFGNLWMSSNHGLFRVRLRDLEAAADGRLPRVESMAFNERDGMLVREANGSVQDTGMRDSSLRLWFPTQQGVVRVDPREALRRERPPRVHVVSLVAGDQHDEEISLHGGEARLSPTQRSFAVRFTAPSFQAPERQRFRYRLAPYDRGWIDAGARREAAYTKVPPGRYTFEVLAAGPDGVWSAAPAAVALELVPRFFETRLFLLACALAAGTVVFAGVRLWGVRQQARQRALERLVEERTATIAQQAEKLLELDSMKSQFFANVSHELRTPLTLTLGPLKDSLDGRFGPLRQDLAGQLEVALRNAGRLLGLVDQLLDIARLDAGRLRLRLRQDDLAEHVRQRVEAFLPLAERQGIELSLEAPAEAVEVWFDEAQLEKVFDNLLGNALKFTPKGGRVEVTLKTRPDGQVEVSVRDDGPGIPPDQLARIFERFYQVEDTDHRWPGAGIGLALARQLVELHRGSISAASEPGQGACFTVALLRGRSHFPSEMIVEEPVAASPASPASPAVPAGTPEAPEPPDLDGEDRTTVLVVDDNAEIRAYIRRLLEPVYRVVEAADGVQGLERARRVVPDLVISDVMMPGLDGNALFRSLREDPELDIVPVILLTAKASAESRIQGLRDGVDDYLVKPFEPRELRARVDNLIASRKRLLERMGNGTPAPLALPPRALRVSEVSVTSADEALLARVQALIEERIGDPELSVESLASTLGCDRSYLLRKMRALTGEPPSSLIRSLRLQRAEQLLRAGAGAVSEVAYGVGFKSVAHFSNAFQERYGERPSAFAARHRSP